MPPPGSQKGTGKKGAGAIRQRSRNTTPNSIPATASLPPIEGVDAEHLGIRVEHFRELVIDDVVDHGALSAPLPDTKCLDGTINRLQRLQDALDLRGTFYDRGMRSLAQSRKNRVDEEEERAKSEEEEREKKNRKKRKAADSLAAPDSKPGELENKPTKNRCCVGAPVNIYSEHVPSDKLRC